MCLADVVDVLKQSRGEVLLDLKTNNFRNGNARSAVLKEEANGCRGRRAQPQFREPDVGIEYDDHKYASR